MSSPRRHVLAPLTRLALGVALAAGLAACGSDSATPTAAPAAAPAPSASSGDSASTPTASGSVEAADQKGDGSSLTVAQVDLEGIDQGFIGVHQDLGGKPGPVVGVAELKKGSTKDLVVRFDKPVKTGAFWPMLHADDHTLGTYEFPKVTGADLPVTDGGQVVMKKITLTVS